MSSRRTTPGRKAARAALGASAGIALVALVALASSCVDAPKNSAGTGEGAASATNTSTALHRTMTDSYGRIVRARCVPAPGSTSCVGVEFSPAPSLDAGAGDDGGLATSGAGVMGWAPADFVSAYNIPLLPTTSVIGLLVASANPNLESDLAVYRSAFGLPACASADGCLTVVTASGGTDFLPPDYDDIAESSLAVQVASAACPACKLVVVVASDDPSRGPTMDELVVAANEAVSLKASVLATSYSAPELDENGLPWAAAYAKLFPTNVFLFAPAGSSGFFDGSSPSAQVGVPAAFPNVTAVGGTTLTQVGEDVAPRRWTESVWPLGGSGCSSEFAKPSFQQDTGCAGRTVTDMAASADPALVYFTTFDATDPTSYAGWHAEGGTGESATLVASIFAATNQGLAQRPAVLVRQSRCLLRRHHREQRRVRRHAVPVQRATRLRRADRKWQPERRRLHGIRPDHHAGLRDHRRQRYERGDHQHRTLGVLVQPSRMGRLRLARRHRSRLRQERRDDDHGPTGAAADQSRPDRRSRRAPRHGGPACRWTPTATVSSTRSPSSSTSSPVSRSPPATTRGIRTCRATAARSPMVASGASPAPTRARRPPPSAWATCASVRRTSARRTPAPP